jgi:hypothetical protein
MKKHHGDHYLWTYCVWLGPYTDSKGRRFDLGIHEGKFGPDLAIAYGPEEHQYRAMPLDCLGDMRRHEDVRETLVRWERYQRWHQRVTEVDPDDTPVLLIVGERNIEELKGVMNTLFQERTLSGDDQRDLAKVLWLLLENGLHTTVESMFG